MASTAAPSAPSFSPRPIHRDAASAAASVTRTSSRARLRSGACLSAAAMRRTLALAVRPRGPVPVACHTGFVVRRLGTAIVAVLVLDLVGVWTVSPSRTAAPTPPTSTSTTAAGAVAAPDAAVLPDPPPRQSSRPTATTTTTRPAGPSIPVTGRVVDADGRGVAKANVTVSQHVEPSTGLAGGFAAIGNGLARMGTCFGTNTPLECRTTAGGTTAGDGTFSLRLPMSVEEGRQVATFDVAVDWPGVSGTRLPVRFDGAGVVAPEIRMWRPSVRVDGGRATWSPLPGGGATYQLSFMRPGPFDRPELWFTVDAGADGVSFERRLLEDVPATAAVNAVAGGRAFWSAAVPAPGPGAPPTRDRPCRVVSERQGQGPVDLPTCPVTDVKSATRIDTGDVYNVIVDLGTPRSLDFAVVRGYPRDFSVDVSQDGTTWTELASSTGGARPTTDRKAAYASQPRSGRYVRLRLDSGFSAQFVEEFAAW